MANFSIKPYNLWCTWSLASETVLSHHRFLMLPCLVLSHMQQGVTCEPVEHRRNSLAMCGSQGKSSVRFWPLVCSRSLILEEAALWTGPHGCRLRLLPPTTVSLPGVPMSEPSQGQTLQPPEKFMEDLCSWPHLQCTLKRDWARTREYSWPWTNLGLICAVHL